MGRIGSRIFPAEPLLFPELVPIFATGRTGRRDAGIRGSARKDSNCRIMETKGLRGPASRGAERSAVERLRMYAREGLRLSASQADATGRCAVVRAWRPDGRMAGSVTVPWEALGKVRRQGDGE